MSDKELEKSNTGKFDFTVVIPAYNEVDQIGPELRRIHQSLQGLGKTYEVIVVDDGSQDGTSEIAAQEECRLIRQQRNMGYGASLKRGIREAKSELIVITDADGTYPPEEIPGLLEAASKYDMVVGSRTGEDVHIPLIRRPAKWFLRVLASYLAEFHIPDLNSGLRVIRREQVKRFAHILPSGFSFTTTITLAHLCNEMTIGYLPINYGKRVGASKIRPSHAYHFLLLILRVIVLFNPLKVFIPLGAATFILGMIKFVYDIGQWNLSESAVMCLLTALVIWCVGLLADQNSRFGLDRQTWKD